MSAKFQDIEPAGGERFMEEKYKILDQSERQQKRKQDEEMGEDGSR